jgi:hypothetical protein
MVAKTPPMGWNSWDCYGASVNEETVRRNADYMAKNLKEFGYEYVVVDIQWYQPTADTHEYKNCADLTMDEFGRLLPAVNRFPSAKNGQGFTELGDYIHSLGLRFGIHIMRGIPRQAVHADTKIKGTGFTARDIAQANSVCAWNPDMYGVQAEAEGASDYYDSIFELYAGWGVDFVKVDDIAREFHYQEIDLIRSAIDRCGREMVLSISPGASPLGQAEYFKQKVNMWRITDDFWDQWDLLEAMFERAEKWAAHSGAGHWPDADMLPVAAINQCYGEDSWTKFTEDELMTMMTLWCFLRSPLMIGSELTKLDGFTLKLLTNPDLLKMLSASFGARQIYRRDDEICWLSIGKAGGYYLAFFNTSDKEKSIAISLAALELEGVSQSFDLWGKNKEPVANTFTTIVKPHGVRAFLVS